MVNGFAADWHSFVGPELPAPLAAEWQALIADPLSDLGVYLTFLGRFARGVAGAGRSTHALTVAAQRLSSDPIARDVFLATLDVLADVFVSAVSELNARVRGRAAATSILAARDDAESLRVLINLVAISDELSLPNDWYDGLVEAAGRVTSEMDILADRHDLAGRTTLALAMATARKRDRARERLSLMDTGESVWWLAPLSRSSLRSDLEKWSKGMADDTAILLGWIEETVEGVDEADSGGLELLVTDLTQLIDRHYHAHRRDDVSREVIAAERRLTSYARQYLRSRTAAVRTTAARVVTLACTLVDRVHGVVAEGARVPANFEALCVSLAAWRTAGKLQSEDAIAIGELIRNHGWPTNGARRPEPLLGGAVAVALQLAHLAQADDARTWLEHAERCAARSRMAHRLTPLTAVAKGYIEVAQVLGSHCADDALRILDHVQSLVAKYKAAASLLGQQTPPLFEIRAAACRAMILDGQGQQALAQDLRRNALGLVAALRSVRGQLAHDLMMYESQLLTELGEVIEAADAMERYARVRFSEPGEQAAASASAVQFRRACFLVEHGYHREGLLSLVELANNYSAPSRWRSRAGSLLADPRLIGLTDVELRLVLGFDPKVDDLESAAQHAYRRARRLAGTDAGPAALEDAFKINAAMLDQNRGDLVAQTRQAQLLTLSGSPDDLSLARELLQRVPDADRDDYVQFCLGHIAYKQRLFGEAIDYLQEAYQRTPRVQTATLLSHALRRAGRHAEALVAINVAGASDAPALDARGAALAAAGDSLGAWTSFDEACARLDLDAEDAPERIDRLVNRLALVAEHVAKIEPEAVRGFLRREPRFALAFITACTLRLAFHPALAALIIEAGAQRRLRYRVAQYAMGAAVVADTCRDPKDAVQWLSFVWNNLGLENEPLMIAEMLAGAKRVYRLAIKSMFDSEPTSERTQRYHRWLNPTPARNTTIVSHVTSNELSKDYYYDARRIVFRDEALWKSRQDFLEEAIGVISHVRDWWLTRLELRDHLELVSTASTRQERVAALLAAAQQARPAIALQPLSNLALADGPRVLVKTTASTVRLIVSLCGKAPEMRLTDEDQGNGLQLTWDAHAAWPVAWRDALEAEELSPGSSTQTLVVPVACRADLEN